MARGAWIAGGLIAGAGAGLAAYFLLPSVLGSSPSCPAGNISTYDSYAASITVTNDAQPGVPLLGPQRVYSQTGPYDTTTGQGSVVDVVYAWYYDNGVPAAFLVISSQSFGTSTSIVSSFVNPTGSTEAVTGITGFTSASPNSVTGVTPP